MSSFNRELTVPAMDVSKEGRRTTSPWGDIEELSCACLYKVEQCRFFLLLSTQNPCTAALLFCGHTSSLYARVYNYLLIYGLCVSLFGGFACK